MKRGFTLIELVLVLGVMTIVTAGIFIATRENNNRVLYDALVVLQADLRYIQRRSMMEGHPHDIMFDRQYNRYNVRRAGSGIGDVRLIRTVYLPNGITFHHVSAQGSRVSFTARGTISGSFTVTLTNGRYRQELTGTLGAGSININPEPERQ